MAVPASQATRRIAGSWGENSCRTKRSSMRNTSATKKAVKSCFRLFVPSFWFFDLTKRIHTHSHFYSQEKASFHVMLEPEYGFK